MKAVNMTIWIYGFKLHNILLSFTKEQKMCIGKEVTYAYMQNISRRVPKKYNAGCLCGTAWETGFQRWRAVYFPLHTVLHCLKYLLAINHFSRRILMEMSFLLFNQGFATGGSSASEIGGNIQPDSCPKNGLKPYRRRGLPGKCIFGKSISVTNK